MKGQFWHVTRHVPVLVRQPMPRCTTSHKPLSIFARRFTQQFGTVCSVRDPPRVSDYSKYLQRVSTDSNLCQGVFTLKKCFGSEVVVRQNCFFSAVIPMRGVARMANRILRKRSVPSRAFSMEHSIPVRARWWRTDNVSGRRDTLTRFNWHRTRLDITSLLLLARPGSGIR